MLYWSKINCNLKLFYILETRLHRYVIIILIALNATLAWQVYERCNMTTNIVYNVLVSCNEKLVAHLASNPKGNAGVMFQNGLISEETNQKINQLE